MEPPKLVDIDTADLSDRENITFSNSIEAHSLIADFYQYRPPYVKEFFDEAVERLEISKDSSLLDLCCGRGELASELSPFCKFVYAVDGSAEMIKNSMPKDNIKYILHDVNHGDLGLPGKVDNLVIGTAIHWVNQESLQKIVKLNLNAGGKIFVTHTMFKIEDRSYYPSLREVNKKYGRRRRPVDLWGAEKLEACGFKRTDRMHHVRRVRFDIEYIFRNQLSHLYRDFYESVSADLPGYRKDVYEALTPFLENNKLSGTLVNWGLIYSPSSDPG